MEIRSRKDPSRPGSQPCPTASSSPQAAPLLKWQARSDFPPGQWHGKARSGPVRSRRRDSRCPQRRSARSYMHWPRSRPSAGSTSDRCAAAQAGDWSHLARRSTTPSHPIPSHPATRFLDKNQTGPRSADFPSEQYSRDRKYAPPIAGTDLHRSSHWPRTVCSKGQTKRPGVLRC